LILSVGGLCLQTLQLNGPIVVGLLQAFELQVFFGQVIASQLHRDA
jgi:hypothetical protein